MTCVGLIGLAMGHGFRKEIFDKLGRGSMALAKKDQQIQRGLKRLGTFVGRPTKDRNKKLPIGDLYYLWSLERVAVLYNLKTIGNKDWYGWASQILLTNQRDDGSWIGNRSWGVDVDTCFALLVLRRANLVEDLTEDLQEYVPVVDPDAPLGTALRQK